MKLKGFNFIALCLIATSVAAILTVWLMRESSGAQQPAVRSDGSIPIAAKYVGQFEAALKEFEQAQATMRSKQDEVEQIGRLTLDLAGVPPSEFKNYSLDAKQKLLKKKTER